MWRVVIHPDPQETDYNDVDCICCFQSKMLKFRGVGMVMDTNPV